MIGLFEVFDEAFAHVDAGTETGFSIVFAIDDRRGIDEVIGIFIGWCPSCRKRIAYLSLLWRVCEWMKQRRYPQRNLLRHLWSVDWISKGA